MAEYHLHIEVGEVAPYVLLPGDPGRVSTIASTWDEAVHIATNREYVTYTGTYQGVPMSCTSTGIGAPRHRSQWRNLHDAVRRPSFASGPAEHFSIMLMMATWQSLTQQCAWMAPPMGTRLRSSLR